MRLVRAALQCYPERWRSRHGEEAAELAGLLMRDGMPARSIAWSYAKGAASTRLLWQPRRRLRAALGALLAAACSLGVSLALLSSSAPASAASVVRLRITNRGDAAGQLRSLVRAHHFRITVTQEPASPGLAGSIINFGSEGLSPGGDVLSAITGPCAGGSWGCIDGIVVRAHFTGTARIVVGRAAKPGRAAPGSASTSTPVTVRTPGNGTATP